jgi:hypothetical protein
LGWHYGYPRLGEPKDLPGLCGRAKQQDPGYATQGLWSEGRGIPQAQGPFQRSTRFLHLVRASKNRYDDPHDLEKTLLNDPSISSIVCKKACSISISLVLAKTIMDQRQSANSCDNFSFAW